MIPRDIADKDISKIQEWIKSGMTTPEAGERMIATIESKRVRIPPEYGWMELPKTVRASDYFAVIAERAHPSFDKRAKEKVESKFKYHIKKGSICYAGRPGHVDAESFFKWTRREWPRAKFPWGAWRWPKTTGITIVKSGVCATPGPPPTYDELKLENETLKHELAGMKKELDRLIKVEIEYTSIMERKRKQSAHGKQGGRGHSK